MKFLLIAVTLFIFVSMVLGSLRSRDKLDKEANKAVGSLATAMRYALYGFCVVVAVASALVLYQGL